MKRAASSAEVDEQDATLVGGLVGKDADDVGLLVRANPTTNSGSEARLDLEQRCFVYQARDEGVHVERPALVLGDQRRRVNR